jgi:hypothetical protein
MSIQQEAMLKKLHRPTLSTKVSSKVPLTQLQLLALRAQLTATRRRTKSSAAMG